MARSFKKQPFVQQQSSGKAVAKRRASRAVRAANKQACRGNVKEELADGKAYRKEFESWDISDYCFHVPGDKKATRK